MSKQYLRPVCLIIRDGWGYNENPRGNAVLSANTPNMDIYKKDYPWNLLNASGEPVGLPKGYQGSSEVGHLNMGAGRIVIQELKRVNDGLQDGSLFRNEKWQHLIKEWKKKRSKLHLLGLLQDEGVHAHQAHLFKIIRYSRDIFPEGEIVIHPFLDGRDTPPRSSLEFLKDLKRVMEEIGNCTIGTVMGRYYAMDRSKKWTLTDKAYNCIVCAQGKNALWAEDAVRESYQKYKTPDNVSMFDEYIPPFSIGNYKGVSDGDCILHTNYRQDRAIQLSMAFVSDAYKGDIKKKPKVVYLGLTCYYDGFENYMLKAMSSGDAMKNLLGEVISSKGLKQLRISETQKFRHVTSFFNGKSTTPYIGEDQIEIKSRFDPATFASHPEMEAYNLTQEFLQLLKDNVYSFILINYANCDMVGHTGDFNAAKKAVEIVDECVGIIVKRLLELDAHILITADHGNAEQMIDYDTGMTKTSHTTFPVEFIYVGKNSSKTKLIPHGKLSDIAPTVLKLLNLNIPKEMTANLLIEE